jgi:anti-sigma factor RsiW
MESCDRLVPLLPDFAEGEATPLVYLRVAAHLDRCGACRRRVEEHRGLIEQLEELPRVVPPPDFRAGVMARIAASRATEGERPLSRSRWIHVLVGAAALATAAGGGTGAAALSRSPWTVFSIVEPETLLAALESAGRIALSLLLEVVTSSQLPSIPTTPHLLAGWGAFLAGVAFLGLGAGAIGLGIAATARALLRPRRG